MAEEVKVHGSGKKVGPKTSKVIAQGKIPKQSKAAKREAAVIFEENGPFEEVTVLVTGFGGANEESGPNPSWSISKILPPQLEYNLAHPSKICIYVHPEPVTPSYDEINQLTSEHYGHIVNFALWLHIGTSNRAEHYAVEQIACRDGYEIPDETERLPDENKQPTYWTDMAPVFETTAALPDVLARWRGVCPGEDLRISSDAGRYVCEYQLYSSLAHMSFTGNATRPWKDRTMVTFLHVPATQDDAAVDVEKGRDVVMGLIYALIDSRRFRDGDYEPGNGEVAPA